MSVDLPAPFSPTSASTSPWRSSRRTSSSACTPGNPLLTPSSSRSGADAAALIAPLQSVRMAFTTPFLMMRLPYGRSSPVRTTSRAAPRPLVEREALELGDPVVGRGCRGDELVLHGRTLVALRAA